MPAPSPTLATHLRQVLVSLSHQELLSGKPRGFPPVEANSSAPCHSWGCTATENRHFWESTGSAFTKFPSFPGGHTHLALQPAVTCPRLLPAPHIYLYIYSFYGSTLHSTGKAWALGAAKADAALALPSPARAGSEEGLSRFLSLPTLLITFHFHYTGKSSIANQLEKGKNNNTVWTLSYLSNCPLVRWLWEFCHCSAPPPSARMHTALSLWHTGKCWRGRSFEEAFRSQNLFLNGLINLWKQLPSVDLSLLIRGANPVPRQNKCWRRQLQGTASTTLLPEVKTR